MVKKILSVLLVVISHGLLTSTAQPPDQPNEGAIVLQTDNTLGYTQSSWQGSRVANAGTQISSSAVVTTQDGTLLVMCPDGSLQEFRPGEIQNNDQLNCDVPTEDYIIEVEGLRVLNVQRGGRQDPTIPYLISPRGTLLRDPNVTLIWNAPPGVLEYQVSIYGGETNTVFQTTLSPQDVTVGTQAELTVPLELQPNTPYSVEICVTFENLTQGCTTDAGWQSGRNTAFFYQPDAMLGNQILSTLEANIIQQLGEDTPTSLYARAVLLSQAIGQNSTGQPIGYYNEAIILLNRLITNHPDSPLANAPEIHYLLGRLYRDIELPTSAAHAFLRASGLAAPGTEVAALSLLGLAATTSDMAYYNQALHQYATFLLPEEFRTIYGYICQLIKDLCAQLQPIDEFLG
jgi:hypothetical protein